MSDPKLEEPMGSSGYLIVPGKPTDPKLAEMAREWCRKHFSEEDADWWFANVTALLERVRQEAVTEYQKGNPVPKSDWEMLVERAERAEAEVATLRSERDKARDLAIRRGEIQVRLTAERDRLREALLYYAMHRKGCTYFDTSAGACSCGLSAALASGEKNA